MLGLSEGGDSYPVNGASTSVHCKVGLNTTFLRWLCRLDFRPDCISVAACQAKLVYSLHVHQSPRFVLNQWDAQRVGEQLAS